MSPFIFLQLETTPIQNMEILTVIFWISLGILFLGFLTMLRWVLPLWFGKKSMGQGLKAEETTLLLVGRNDPEGFEKWIRACTSEMIQLELIAIDNQSEDETANELEALKRELAALKVVTLPASERFWGTRKLALTLGVKASTRPYCIWVDTRCEVPENLTAWHRGLTSPLRRGNALASFAPVLTPKASPLRDRIQAFSHNIWAQIRAQPLAPSLIAARMTGMIPVNFAFKTDSFFEVKGYITSMHLDGGEAEFLLNDIRGIGNVVPVSHSSAYLVRPWVYRADPKMNQHRTKWERLAWVRHGMLLLLVDMVALAAGLHLSLLLGQMSKEANVDQSAEFQFVIGQLEVILGMYVLLQVILHAYLVSWIRKLKLGWGMAILVPVIIRTKLLFKALTFWKK